MVLLHRQFYCFESATKTSKPIAKPTNAGLMFWLFMATSNSNASLWRVRYFYHSKYWLRGHIVTN